MKWNYGQTSVLIHFLEKQYIDNIESPIPNNIWVE